MLYEDSIVWAFLFTCLLVFDDDDDKCCITLSSISDDVEIEDAVDKVDFHWIESDSTRGRNK